MPLRQEIEIGPQSGGSVRVREGETVRVVDPEGQQVADLWAFVLDGGLVDWLSVSQTRDMAERMFPKVGEHFYSDRAAPLLTLVEDNSPSPHDMLFPACDRGLYERAGLPGHPNCRDNMLRQLRDAGVELPFVPDPVNLFQRSEPQADGRLEVFASDNPPGGNVLLRANQDLLLVVTACSVDFHPTNGGRCTGIRLELSSGGD
ncbi:urea carboxylase-associated family protein [Fulvimarina endophytica]|uniref:Urea carboxylase-associated family protein n=1 Tax=Fulvimarina endophytica TaxID=2293836 RepID=A0A371X470_9HYPH|nr:urea carboxylase-associated family protein [Fulvimarina endophytica]RFC64031.1 urea carboxylase-associated family protein [Fulvimarina endophytica]